MPWRRRVLLQQENKVFRRNSEFTQAAVVSIMDFTEHVDEVDDDKPLNLFQVLWLLFQSDEQAIEVAEFLERYARSLPIGNNQLPSITFLPEKGGVFGAADRWDTKDEEEVM